ncbi:hypothetical protein NXV74_02725 [Bacteroides thetaiotaomicron]|nr:hypothetical protein [Bacteroides thetaiotaomicron]
MFLSLTLLTISTTATYAVQPKDDKKENEALQTSTEEHLPLLTINGTNASSSFIVNSEALLGKEITITAPNGFTVTPTVIAANSGKQKVKVTLNSTKRLTEGENYSAKWRRPFIFKSKRIWNRSSCERHCSISCLQERK